MRWGTRRRHTGKAVAAGVPIPAAKRPPQLRNTKSTHTEQASRQTMGDGPVPTAIHQWHYWRHHWCQSAIQLALMSTTAHPAGQPMPKEDSQQRMTSKPNTTSSACPSIFTYTLNSTQMPMLQGRLHTVFGACRSVVVVAAVSVVVILHCV